MMSYEVISKTNFSNCGRATANLQIVLLGVGREHHSLIESEPSGRSWKPFFTGLLFQMIRLSWNCKISGVKQFPISLLLYAKTRGCWGVQILFGFILFAA
ncbi:hypothetical protein SAY86_009675 [Trapa natans]|uniref:Uncharacterized protein n=1 Tax=Trapa natans TaxID=22666 RepID=A0AAN7QT77_TRANT|nr:hypothetical protein SAY86_009675 [Trapa natans]